MRQCEWGEPCAGKASTHGSEGGSWKHSSAVRWLPTLRSRYGNGLEYTAADEEKRVVWAKLLLTWNLLHVEL